MNDIQSKLSLLRTFIKTNGIDVYIIPSTDPHLGEYIPDHWRIISWLTGFTGSSATVVVTESFAGLWTDSRYYAQAEVQLRDSGFELMRPASPDKTDFIWWIAENIDTGSKIALDGRIFSIEQIRKLIKTLDDKTVSFNFDCDLISVLWTDRPPMPGSHAFDHSTLYCGKERSVKIAEVREKMRIRGVDYHLLTSTDDIMWLLNIRGKDVKYSQLLT